MTQWYVRHGPYGDREALTADTRDDAARQWSLACGFRQPPVHEGRGSYCHEGTHTGPGEPAPTFRVSLPRTTEGRGEDELTWVVTLANRHPVGTWAVRELTLTHPEAPELHIGRADLAIITPGFTCGYEIKTARDKLTHLSAQVPRYAPQFDAWHLAVATKHVTEARTLAPTAWGLIELKDDGTFTVLRAAHTSKGHFSVERLLWTLTGEDLLALYKLFYTRWPHKTTRAVLIAYLLKARHEQVMELALRHIRTRGHLRMQSWKVGGTP